MNALLCIVLFFFATISQRARSYTLLPLTQKGVARSGTGRNFRLLDRKSSVDETSAKEASSSSSSPEDGINPLTKASWYAVEAFGKVFGKKPQGGSSSPETKTSFSLDESPSSRAETLQRIKDDNEREYFLSGQVDKLIYDKDCTFADPFVSFDGRDRFVDNLANLGSFITSFSAKELEYTVEETAVQTKFMVKLQLNLPWKPILAWPWGVRCEIDPETFLIVRHDESWDIAPLEGVKQIFRKPTTSIRKD